MNHTSYFGIGSGNFTITGLPYANNSASWGGQINISDHGSNDNIYVFTMGSAVYFRNSGNGTYNISSFHNHWFKVSGWYFT
jgi:hypothetical protein